MLTVRRISRFFLLTPALVLAGCAGLGLPVPVGGDVAYEGKSKERIGFSFPEDWEIVESPARKGGFPVYQFKFKTFPRYIVRRGERSLWEASRCFMFIDSTEAVNPTIASGRDLLVRNLQDNLPKDLWEAKSRIAFKDVPFDAEDYPTVMSRVEARYQVSAKETITQGYKTLSTSNKLIPWHSFGQALQVGSSEVYLLCKGDVRYNNQFEGLAESLADSFWLKGA